MKKIILFAIGSLFVNLFSSAVTAQTNTELFGQNRIQLRTFNWKYYATDNLKIYFYDRAGVELSRYVAEQMEKDLALVQNKMGDVLPPNLDVVVYNCYDDFKQTNIGLAANNTIQNNPAGSVNIIDNKLTVYFTGTHADIKRQLRAGLYSIILEKTLFGENLKESLRNSLVLNFPKWYLEGYLNYMLDGWDSKANSSWKAIVQDEDKSKRFEELARLYPTLAGKAYWKYLIERYGERDVKDFIFIAENESNLNTATKALTKQKIVPSFDSLINYYQEKYALDDASELDVRTETPLINIENKDPETRISRIRVSPRGVDVAYVSSKNGEFQVNLQKSEKVDGIAKNRIATILKGGILNHNEPLDPEYPILAWSYTGYKLGVIYRKYDLIYLRVFDAVKAKVTNYIISQRKFDRILSFTFMEDDDKIVVSAIKNGQSDLFEYRMKRGQVTQLTDDPYDDLEPVYVSGGSRKGIVFLSNRPEPYINIRPLPNELPSGKMNGFFYNATTKSYELLNLTKDAKGDVFQVIPYGQDNFAYLTNDNGVVNRNVVAFKRNEFNLDVPVSISATNGNYGILSHQYNPASKSIADAIETPKGIDVYFRQIELPEPFGNLKSINRIQTTLSEEQFLNNSKKDALIQEKTELKPKKDKKPIEDNAENRFQTRFSRDQKEALDADEIVAKTTIDSLANESKLGKTLYVDSTFIRLRSRTYRGDFKADFLSIKLDNNQLFTRYQSFTGFVTTPSLGGMLSASVFDKMEDYRFTAGYRLPILSDGSAYFLQFDNFRRRLDWNLTYFRETKNLLIPIQFNSPSGSFVKEYRMKPISNIIQGAVSYPLDRTKSIRANLGLRQDRTALKTTDVLSDLIENEDKYYATSRIEYVHDDTKMRALNIPEGLKMKFFGEYLYKLHDDNVYSTSDAVRKNTGGFFNVGFDIRNYLPIYKNATVALRASFAHSGGNDRILYVMGGVDNALNAKNANYPYGQLTYAFQSQTTSLRGYDQNARNGNTYGLINAELRVPVFETFFRRPMQTSLLKNLQAVAFIDAGSAWEGLVPVYSRPEKRHSTYVSPNTPNAPGKLVITIPYSGDDQMAVGYGLGLRTMLYGYYFRTDAAWNINGQFRLHIGMGFDF